MEQRIRLDIEIPPDWGRIDPIREAVGLCITVAFGGGDLKDAISMVSAELLENAVKYGRIDRSLRFGLEANDERIVIAVTNSIDEPSREVAQLRERLGWLGSFSSAAEAYLAALGDLYNAQPDPTVPSGLGLVRVAYEGGCSLELATAPGHVTVRAIHRLQQEGWGP